MTNFRQFEQTVRGALLANRLAGATRRHLALVCGLAFVCGLIRIPAHADSLVPLVLTGSWGGEHIRLVVTETGARVEYDCAVGRIDEPLLPDKEGTFQARGIHVFERGGPRILGEPPPKAHPALYRGWTNGSEMRLTVTLLDTGAEVGTFSLGLGRQSLLEKCL